MLEHKGKFRGIYMRKLAYLSAVIVLLVSCAVSPVTDSDNPRTLYIVQTTMTFGGENSASYIAETVNRNDIVLAIENLFQAGHTGFDALEEIIFDEVNGTFRVSSSVSSAGTAGTWTLDADVIPAFESIAKKADSNDLLIYFIAGHGMADGSLCFYNPDSNHGIDLLSPADFISIMDGIRCNKLAFFLTCFSGTIADLGSGAMSDGLEIASDGELFTTEFSICKALSEAMSLQLGQGSSPRGNLWMIAASRSDQESMSFNMVDENGERTTWDPFIDYIAQSFEYDDTDGSFAVTGQDRLSAMDIAANIARLYNTPVAEASPSIPAAVIDSLDSLGEADMPLLSWQVLDYSLSGADLVIF